MTYYKVYFMYLNNIKRNPDKSDVKFDIVARSFEKQKLIDWHNSQLIQINGEIKFKKDSLLEQYQPIIGDFDHNKETAGIYCDWIDNLPSEEEKKRLNFIE